MIIEEKEQLVRVVSQIGNGAHIFAPKEWINEKVLIVRLEKKTVKEQILKKLFPYLDKIIAVFLYGSHARGEAEESSDIDVLVIAKEKFKLEKESGEDFIVLTEKEIPQAISTNPLLLYSVIKESIAIINQDFLEKLRDIKIEKKNFKKYLEQTADSIKSSEEIIVLDKKTGHLSSDSVIYSAILRLRGLLIVQSLLDRNSFSNRSFRNYLERNNFSFDKVYAVYRRVRNGEFGKDTNVPIEQEEKLVSLLKQELNKLIKII